MASYIDPATVPLDTPDPDRSYGLGLRTSETLSEPALHPPHQSVVHPKPQIGLNDAVFSLMQARYG